MVIDHTHSTLFLVDRLILDSEKKRRETTKLYGEDSVPHTSSLIIANHFVFFSPDRQLQRGQGEFYHVYYYSCLCDSLVVCSPSVRYRIFHCQTLQMVSQL